MVKFTTISLSVERVHKGYDLMTPRQKMEGFGVSPRGPGSWMVGRTAREIDAINEEADRTNQTCEAVAAQRQIPSSSPIGDYEAEPPGEGYRLKQTHLIHESSEALLLLVWESPQIQSP